MGLKVLIDLAFITIVMYTQPRLLGSVSLPECFGP